MGFDDREISLAARHCNGMTVDSVIQEAVQFLSSSEGSVSLKQPRLVICMPLISFFNSLSFECFVLSTLSPVNHFISYSPRQQ
jgi:hypothetical protein